MMVLYYIVRLARSLRLCFKAGNRVFLALKIEAPELCSAMLDRD